jgi:hypothetical protein
MADCRVSVSLWLLPSGARLIAGFAASDVLGKRKV